MNSNSENVCPCCGRHCSVGNLHCARGKAHFGIEIAGNREEQHQRHSHFRENMTTDGEIIALMRGCGHYLHHNMNKDRSEDLLYMLSDAEKKKLILLLKKCLKEWNN